MSTRGSSDDREAIKQQARDAWLAGEVELATSLLRPLAEGGDPEAQLDLGEMLLRLPSDAGLEEALGWIERAAEAGDVTAAYRLAGLHWEASPVCRRPDAAKAKRWCSVAHDAFAPRAEAGEPEAQFALANLTGYLGFETLDAATTLRWYTRAAEQGFAPAVAVLGAYHAAEGNLEQARRWRERARQLDRSWPSLDWLASESADG